MADSKKDWRNGNSFDDGFKRMLDDQIGCDVTFFVGSERDIVNAHKVLLIRCSEVFEAMFLGGLSEQSKDIELPDIDKDTFTTFLDFVYDCEIDFTQKNVVRLLYVAKKYNVEPLVRKIHAFFENLVPETACVALELGNTYDDGIMKTNSLAYIEQNAELCLKAEAFKDISPKTVEIILSSDNLNIEENIIYTELLQWAEKECTRKNVTGNDENKRSVLGNIIFLVRFPAMDKEFFAKSVANTGLLNDQETISVFISFFDQFTQTGPFVTKPRNNRPLPVCPCKAKQTCAKCAEVYTADLEMSVLCKTCYSNAFGRICTRCAKTIATPDVKIFCQGCIYNIRSQIDAVSYCPECGCNL